MLFDLTVAFALFSISRSRTSCRWLRSCRPIEAVEGLLLDGVGAGLLLVGAQRVAVAGVVIEDVGVGFASFPASVIALSLLLFFSNPAAPITSLGMESGNPSGDEIEFVGGTEPSFQLVVADPGAPPPPNWINSSKHSHEIPYLELRV